MNTPVFLAFALLVACSSDSTSTRGSADGAVLNTADAANLPDAEQGAADAMPSPDANLSDHGFADIDNVFLEFDDIFAYNGSIGDRTISLDVGSDCPFGADCTTMYVSFPQDAQPGFMSCDDAGSVGVQLTIDGARYFSFGSSAASCSFTLDVNDGETVAVSGLRARLEQNNIPSLSKNVSNGEARYLRAGGF